MNFSRPAFTYLNSLLPLFLTPTQPSLVAAFLSSLHSPFIIYWSCNCFTWGQKILGVLAPEVLHTILNPSVLASVGWSIVWGILGECLKLQARRSSHHHLRVYWSLHLIDFQDSIRGTAVTLMIREHACEAFKFAFMFLRFRVSLKPRWNAAKVTLNLSFVE